MVHLRFEIKGIPGKEHLDPVVGAEFELSLEHEVKLLALVAHEDHVARLHGLKLDQEGFHVLFRVLGLEGFVDVVHLALAVVGPPLDLHALPAPGHREPLQLHLVLEEEGHAHVEGLREAKERSQGRDGLVALDPGKDRLGKPRLGGHVLEGELLFLAAVADAGPDLDSLVALGGIGFLLCHGVPPFKSGRDLGMGKT